MPDKHGRAPERASDVRGRDTAALDQVVARVNLFEQIDFEQVRRPRGMCDDGFCGGAVRWVLEQWVVVGEMDVEGARLVPWAMAFA